jgi:serine/threonine-protein kinase
MAPEQLRARAVTAKVDQYALGVILYECATGGAPFYEEDHYALLHAIMTAPIVPPSELVPGLSPAFDALVLRALSRDPEQRYGSVEQLGEALLELADEPARLAWGNELAPLGATMSGVSSESERPVAKGRAARLWLSASLPVAAAAVATLSVLGANPSAPRTGAAGLIPAPRVQVVESRPAPPASSAAAKAPSSPSSALATTVASAPSSRPAPARAAIAPRHPRVSPAPAPALAPVSAPPPEPTVERGTANIPIVE